MGVFDRLRSAEVSIEVAIEAAEAIGQAGDPRLSAEQSSKNWVEIPSGEFWMGAQDKNPSEPNFDPDSGDRRFEFEGKTIHLSEGPVHRVFLDAYQIGCYPVTVAEYQRFVIAGGYEDRNCWGEGGFAKWSEPAGWEAQLRHPSRPVVGVSWYEAAAYACWADARLPAEAQWEKAARGEGAEHRYPWGDEEATKDLLNCHPNVGQHPTPVGVYPRGAAKTGISDLAGNVWEWCRDWYRKYPKRGRRNPEGPREGEGRVLRGGAWFSGARYCRCSFRLRIVPTARFDVIGFRVVLVSSSARTKKRKS